MPIDKFDPAKHTRTARGAFDCGVPELNDFLQKQAKRQQKAGVNRTYLAVDNNPTAEGDAIILGFYCISAGSVGYEMLPDDRQKKIPRYPVPIALIGRLAVDQSAKGTGLGKVLLRDALARIVGIADEFGIYAVVVDAKNEAAKGFYEKFGFMSFSGHPMKLFIPLKTVISAL